MVRVADCGFGVPADALEKLFQPFYRLDDARGRQTGGVGLGLAITERAVRFHGGRVAAANRAEGGLMVEIHLPMMPASAGSKKVSNVPVDRESSTASTQSQYLVKLRYALFSFALINSLGLALHSGNSRPTPRFQLVRGGLLFPRIPDT